MKTKLTNRMTAIANMVIKDKSCADIGTDHGYIPAYLLENEICPWIVLSDINEGPLAKAKENLSHIDKVKYNLRLGDGIKILKPNEVSTVIIAGMGGELIEQILGFDLDKSKSFEKIILQPRTKCDELRMWLSSNGFKITEYALAEERGRICEVFSVKKSEKKFSDELLLSKVLFKTKDPLKEEFIKRKIKARENLVEELNKSKKDESKRIAIIEKEIEKLKEYI